MTSMPRPRPPFLQRETTRHGKTVWYFRQNDGPRVRIKAEFGTPEFTAAYQAAVSGTALGTLAKPIKPTSGTLIWLLDRYRDSSAWAVLSVATRRQRENIFRQVIGKAGQEPATSILREDILDGKERRKATPFQARHFLDAMRGLFKWALAADLVKIDPTAGIENPKRKDTGGFPVWTEADVIAFERRWPIGTKERVWLAVLLYTGLRRGDAVRIGRQHVSDGVAAIKTAKSGETVEVTIPLLPVLVEVLRAGPCGDLAFICGDNGRPLTKESFGNMFSDACRKAGVKKSAHGVRKIGATRAANNGATVAELEAIFGWSGGRMAALYTRGADRRRLAKRAIGMLELEQKVDVLSPHPTIPIPAPKKKPL